MGMMKFVFLVISQQNLSETSLMPIIWLNFRKNNYEKILPLMWAIKEIEALRKTRKWITDWSYEARVEAALNA
jgi:hypothetical protein